MKGECLCLLKHQPFSRKSKRVRQCSPDQEASRSSVPIEEDVPWVFKWISDVYEKEIPFLEWDSCAADEIRVDDITLTTVIAKTAFSLPSVGFALQTSNAINAIRGDKLNVKSKLSFSRVFIKWHVPGHRRQRRVSQAKLDARDLLPPVLLAASKLRHWTHSFRHVKALVQKFFPSLRYRFGKEGLLLRSKAYLRQGL